MTHEAPKCCPDCGERKDPCRCSRTYQSVHSRVEDAVADEHARAIYLLRVINSLSSDEGSIVDVPLSCSKVRAHLSAWSLFLLARKSVALLERQTVHGKPAMMPILILE